MNNIVFVKGKEDIQNHSDILNTKKTFVWIQKTDENKCEVFWKKDVNNIVMISKIENHFKNIASVVNPAANFIKKSLNRNISVLKSFIRPNKKSTVIDIGFFSLFYKELIKVLNDPKDSLIKKYCNEVLWVIDERCMEEVNKQYEEEYLSKWLEDNKDKFEFDLFEHQREAFIEALKYPKRLIRAHTGSGKGLIITALWYFYSQHVKNVKTLIIVPFVQLLNQLEQEIKIHFPEIKVLKIGGDNMNVFGYGDGEFIDINKSKYDVVISTYQSLPAGRKGDVGDNVSKFLEKFGKEKPGLLIIDETHKSKASTIQEIIGSMKHCKYRVGVSGTMVNYDDNKWDLYHLFSKFRYAYKTVTNIVELEEKKILTPLNFNFIVMKTYSSLESYKRLSYQEEVEYIVNNERRFEASYEYIKNKHDDKNTILFFNRIELGKKYYNKALKDFPKGKVYLITGETDYQLRDNIKAKIENENGILLFASYGTSSTGINFKNLHRCYMLETRKSNITIGQSLGRLQRTLEGKDSVDVYFIIDKFDSYNNYSWQHSKNIIKTLKNEFGEERVTNDVKNNRIDLT